MDTICYKKTNIELNVTLYRSKKNTNNAVVLYFHGGGLLYGKRTDLPEYHINTLCDAGYSILAFDYRLAPTVKLNDIVTDVKDAVSWYLDNRMQLFNFNCPYFLWGRSAGAYLCLLAGRMDLPEKPVGILSYYGYAFIQDTWYSIPSMYYSQFPAVAPDIVAAISEGGDTAEGTLDTRYSLYVYARQTGKWISMLFDNSMEDFFRLFSFKNTADYNDYPPVLFAHSFHDPDVPFAESQVLSSLIPNSRLFVASARAHDFDKDVTSEDTISLIEETLSFINEIINRFPLKSNLTEAEE